MQRLLREAAVVRPKPVRGKKATSFSEDGKTSVYRSRWVRSGDDAYDDVTEFQGKDGAWVPGFKVHMQKLADKSP